MKKLFIINLLALLMYGNTTAQQIYSLDDCRRMALENNAKIKEARLAIEQAREQEHEAFSKYFPTVSATGSYFKANDYMMKEKISLTEEQQQKLGEIIGNLGLDPSALSSLPTSYTLEAIDHGSLVNVMAMLPLYAGGQITAGNKLARLQTQVRNLQMQQSRDEVVRTTELYYNRLLALGEKLHTLDAVEKQLAQIHNDAQNAYEGGLATKNDLLTVELKQNEIAASRLKLENGLKLSKMILAQYMGATDEEIAIDTVLPQELPPPASCFTDHTAALDCRPEAQLLEKNVEANKLQTKLKKGALLPTLAVGGAGIYQDLSNTGYYKAIGLATLSVPISEWWSGSHSVRHQQIAVQTAMLERENNRQLLLIQMQGAYDDLVNSYRQIELARKSIEKSSENLRLSRDNYQAGTAPMSDLLDAQTQEQQAHDRYTDAVTQYLDCRTAYLIVTGRGAGMEK